MPSPRKKLTARAAEQALKRTKVLILDIDGVLTDTKIFYVEGTGWGANYSVVDGFGIKLLKRNGIEVAFISGGNFLSHKKRAEALEIKHAYFGSEEKLGSFEKIRKDLGVTEAECAYMGDELFDIPLLLAAGFAATPPHSPEEVKRAAHYITKQEGGQGAVREICDMILRAQSFKKR
jgi:3-deoxy-D-manno-octulosonate 8-phosphate phosphatase (KDO 8-P phosphatase)